MTTADTTEIAGVIAAALSVSGDPMVVVEQQFGDDGCANVIRWANRLLCERARCAMEDLVGASLESILASRAEGLPLSELSPTSFAAVLSGRDGSLSAWEAQALPMQTAGQFWVITLRPPIVAGSAEEKLAASEARFRALADDAPVGIVASSVGIRLGYVNRYLAALIGSAADSLLGMGWTLRLHPDDSERVIMQLIDVISGVPAEITARLVTVAGIERWVVMRAVPVVSPDNAAGFVASVEDVTERRAYEQAIAWRATHDPLTGLRNRAGLAEEINAATMGLDGTFGLAVLFVDLDAFKAINDTHGHEIGDTTLVTAAQRLRSTVRLGDVVYRYAGDEFVILAHGVTSPHEAELMAERVTAIMTEDLVIDGAEVKLRASVGAAWTASATDSESLLRAADDAMYAAKRRRAG